MNTYQFCMNRCKHGWTRMKVDQNFRVCSRYLGHMTSVWNRHPNFCGSVWRPYYSTQNMWNSFTSIINTYTVASTFMPNPFFEKVQFFPLTNIFVFDGKRLNLQNNTKKSPTMLLLLQKLLLCSWCSHVHPEETSNNLDIYEGFRSYHNLHWNFSIIPKDSFDVPRFLTVHLVEPTFYWKIYEYQRWTGNSKVCWILLIQI